MKATLYLAIVALFAISCSKTDGDSSFQKPKEHLTGVFALSVQLDKSKLTMTSTMERSPPYYNHDKL